MQACLLYYRCRRVLSKAQLAGIQSPDPHAQTGLRIITFSRLEKTRNFGGQLQNAAGPGPGAWGWGLRGTGMNDIRKALVGQPRM